MVRGQKASINGIELFLCPFTDMFITQGPNESYSHKGIMAIDVRGVEAGVKYPYYAPATSKCLKIYPDSGQAMWQTVNDVRCSNGYIGKVTYMTVHDDTLDAKVGQIVSQGSQLGNMGTKSNATGVHCHIEFSQGSDTSWFKNQYGNYMFNNEVDPEDVCFMDNTNILNGIGNWKYAGSLYIGTPIERDLKKEQIEVITSKFYPTGRKEPMGAIKGFVKAGIYNILETKEQNNLTWYKIDNELWIDFGNDWAKVLPKEDETEEIVRIKELENIISMLKEQIQELEIADKAKDNLIMSLNVQINTLKEDKMALEERVIDLVDQLDILTEKEPNQVFKCVKSGTYKIQLKENETLYIG